MVSAGESSSTAGSADVDSSQKMDLYFREARMADLPQINALEAAGYPDDEAATPEVIVSVES